MLTATLEVAVNYNRSTGGVWGGGGGTHGMGVGTAVGDNGNNWKEEGVLIGEGGICHSKETKTKEWIHRQGRTHTSVPCNNIDHESR